ncbi:MAG TPA: glycosyltransferase family 2 protein [Phycisphaerales bacterium]|nr:glycosyltransferase family 2 protein [Phycisphaerales bacterium]
MRTLIAIPVYNEEKYVPRVLASVIEHAPGSTRDIVVIDDGSTDRTSALVEKFPVGLIRHQRNLGYGASIIDAFHYATREGYDWVITMDCDEQHEPARIPFFVAEQARTSADILSGSRYIASMDEATTPPADRRAINVTLTEEVNRRLGFEPPLTDTFCGFKSHRVSALSRLALTETGYAFPMQFWVQVAAARMAVSEIPVKLIYKDLTRSFGGALNDPTTRLAHYRNVLHCEIERLRDRLPALAAAGTSCGCG